MEGYREPAKRKKIPRRLRKWFVQNPDGTERGPFEYGALISSGRAERLKPSTLVRAEDETEWQPLSRLQEKEDARVAKQKSDLGFADDGASSANEAEDPGNFGAGLVAGLCCGLIGFLVVSLTSKGRETKRGARWGLMIQFGIGILLRVVAASGAH